MGQSEAAWLSHHQTWNLLRVWPGPPRRGTKGDAFPSVKARQAADRFDISGGDVLVMVGRQVARAFDRGDEPYFRWFVVTRPAPWNITHKVSAWAVVVPHPSGANHWWNSWDNRERALRFFVELARWARDHGAARRSSLADYFAGVPAMTFVNGEPMDVARAYYRSSNRLDEFGSCGYP